MSAEEQLAGLLEEGKAFLRQGRELSRSGYEYGEADALLQDAMACFEEAAAIDPTSTKVLVCPFEQNIFCVQSRRNSLHLPCPASPALPCFIRHAMLKHAGWVESRKPNGASRASSHGWHACRVTGAMLSWRMAL